MHGLFIFYGKKLTPSVVTIPVYYDIVAPWQSPQTKEIGKKVVLNPLITCGSCSYCTNKKEHLCPKRIILGMNRPIKREGGFAEYVSILDKNIYQLPKNLDMKEAPIGFTCFF